FRLPRPLGSQESLRSTVPRPRSSRTPHAPKQRSNSRATWPSLLPIPLYHQAALSLPQLLHHQRAPPQLGPGGSSDEAEAVPLGHAEVLGQHVEGRAEVAEVEDADEP